MNQTDDLALLASYTQPRTDGARSYSMIEAGIELIDKFSEIDLSKVLEYLPKVLEAISKFLDIKERLFDNKEKAGAMALSLDEVSQLGKLNVSVPIKTADYRQIVSSSHQLAAAARNLHLKGQVDLHRTHQHLRHIKLLKNDKNDIAVRFGQTEETKTLRGVGFIFDSASSEVRPLENDLKVYRVVMLGPTQAGKTTFLTSMYGKLLTQKPFGISLQAIDSRIGLQLTDDFRTLILKREFPASTSDQKEYYFNLLIDNVPAAVIEWIDYPGGWLFTDPSKTNSTQREENITKLTRILERADVIMWLLNIPSDTKPNTLQAQLKSALPDLIRICHGVTVHSKKPRAWIFARSKSDEVVNVHGHPDYNTALEELRSVLGNTIRIANSEQYVSAYRLPVSSVGAANDKDPQPHLVEWPLLLAVSQFLLSELAPVITEYELEKNRLSVEKEEKTKQAKSMLARLKAVLGSRAAQERLSGVTQALQNVSAKTGDLRHYEDRILKIITEKPSQIDELSEEIK